jgi:hypothetical protein
VDGRTSLSYPGGFGLEQRPMQGDRRQEFGKRYDPQ